MMATHDGFPPVRSLGMLVLLCWISLELSTASPTAKREIGSAIDVNVDFIQKAATKLTQDRFKGDKMLTQNVDRANSKTYYKDLGDTARIHFTRDDVDSGKAVIVLNDNEDQLPTKGKKRTYVVLVQVNKEKKYYPLYAYVRYCNN